MSDISNIVINGENWKISDDWLRQKVTDLTTDISINNTDFSNRITTNLEYIKKVDTRLAIAESKIPTDATSSNRLITENNVTTRIYNSELKIPKFLGEFNSLTELQNFVNSSDIITENDYAIVTVDESKNNQVSMYYYNITTSSFDFGYCISEYFNSTQRDAINSGVNSPLLSELSTRLSNSELNLSKDITTTVYLTTYVNSLNQKISSNSDSIAANRLNVSTLLSYTAKLDTMIARFTQSGSTLIITVNELPKE